MDVLKMINILINGTFSGFKRNTRSDIFCSGRSMLSWRYK
jgi:hypothetical protein